LVAALHLLIYHHTDTVNGLSVHWIESPCCRGIVESSGSD
jgi:hypothetical protein